MTLRVIQVNTEIEFSEIVENIAKKPSVIDSWKIVDEKNNKLLFSFLTSFENAQTLLDVLESSFSDRPSTRIIVQPISATLPTAKIVIDSKADISAKKNVVVREELYHTIIGGADLSRNYVLLVLLSTIVAVIGLLVNNVTVIISAMLITPMLGPNLALSLSSVLGDGQMMVRAIKSSLAGIVLCLFLSFLIGLIWPYGVHSTELVLRTDVGFDGVILALASGAAAALSLTTALSSILAGVMVGAALLPPLATLGVMLGAGMYHLAVGAGLLFAVNIVCVNLTASLIFLYQGISPQKWHKKQQARKAVFWQMLFCVIILLILGLAIYFRHGLMFID